MTIVYMETNAAHDTAVGMKIKVLLNRVRERNQGCGGAAKHRGRELRLLELKSEPCKEEGGGGPISSVPVRPFQGFWVYF